MPVVTTLHSVLKGLTMDMLKFMMCILRFILTGAEI